LTETVRDGNREHDFAAVRMRHSDVTGEHLRDGILLVHGPGIRRGALDGPASIYHVAPTLLYLLGLPQDGRMLRWAPADGGVLEAILDPELLASRPITTIADYSGTDRSQLARRRQSSPEDPSQVEAMERLRSLGYIR
jgi:hypothetical protein